MDNFNHSVLSNDNLFHVSGGKDIFGTYVVRFVPIIGLCINQNPQVIFKRINSEVPNCWEVDRLIGNSIEYFKLSHETRSLSYLFNILPDKLRTVTMGPNQAKYLVELKKIHNEPSDQIIVWQQEKDSEWELVY